MPWTIEDVGEGIYGLVLTCGKTSRTVFQASTARDAHLFLEMAEVYDLLHSGVASETLFATKPKRTRKNR